MMTLSEVYTPPPPDLALAPAEDYELSNYRLHERLGQEELATIYLASHLALKRSVQVHILRRTDQVSLQRFQLTARLTARLSHPNLLPIIDAGHDDRYGDYFITPLLDARPLSEVLASGPLEPVLALRIATQIAAALGYLHAQQIIHRDLQPANILLTPQGLAYLTNLSLADSPETPDFSGLASSDYLTPYSAPEIRLDSPETAVTVDIYSLGAILYQLLSGTVPYPPSKDLPSLAAKDPLLKGVDRVLRRMLASQPEVRFASVGDAIAALRHALRTQLDQATEDSVEEWRWSPVAEWLENPLEALLNKVLEDYIEESTVLADVPHYVDAIEHFQDYIRRSRARADKLHRADTVRRLLNRWSRKGFFRRSALGQILQLEQVVSYNLHFYELATLYETRTPPQPRRRPQRSEDRPATGPLPGLWEISVPLLPAFTEVAPQEITLPSSTRILPCPQCRGLRQVVCKVCKGTGVVDHPQPQAEALPEPAPTEVLTAKCGACGGSGQQTCALCEGSGNLVEEQTFTWARETRFWKSTDDMEDLPRLLPTQRAEVACRIPINVVDAQRWQNLAPVAALLALAREDVPEDSNLIAAELTIRSVPITEVDYQLNDAAQQLYLIGFENEVVGNWTLLNPERIALVVVFTTLLLVILLVFILPG